MRELADINRLVGDFSEKMLKTHGAPIMSETDIGDGIATTRVVSVESQESAGKSVRPSARLPPDSPFAKVR